LRGIAVIENLKPDELVDVTGRERRLVELHAELLHADRGNVNHRMSPERLPTAPFKRAQRAEL